MSQPDDERLGLVLAAAAAGDRLAASQVLPLVYEQLRELARRRLARLPPGHTLQPTALVHEVYLRLTQRGDPGWPGEAQFLAAAARAMRNILVDHARARGALKRGGGLRPLHLDEQAVGFDSAGDNVLALDEAITQLEAHDSRKAEIVTLRCFGGLTADQTAAVVGVTARTVERDWRYAKAWLRRELDDEPSPARGDEP